MHHAPNFVMEVKSKSEVRPTGHLLLWLFQHMLEENLTEGLYHIFFTRRGFWIAF